jgi:uncharacterized protein (DUF2235 family)
LKKFSITLVKLRSLSNNFFAILLQRDGSQSREELKKALNRGFDAGGRLEEENDKDILVWEAEKNKVLGWTFQLNLEQQMKNRNRAPK